jgi:hypothetical protein
LVESHASVAEAVRRAIWLSERDTDEYYVYDPSISDVVFSARQFFDTPASTCPLRNKTENRLAT